MRVSLKLSIRRALVASLGLVIVGCHSMHAFNTEDVTALVAKQIPEQPQLLAGKCSYVYQKIGTQGVLYDGVCIFSSNQLVFRPVYEDDISLGELIVIPYKSILGANIGIANFLGVSQLQIVTKPAIWGIIFRHEKALGWSTEKQRAALEILRSAGVPESKPLPMIQPPLPVMTDVYIPVLPVSK